MTKYLVGPSIKVRLTGEECLLLTEMMRADGWENISGYIKEHLFGKNAVVKFRNHLKKAAESPDPEYFGLLLRDACYYLAEVYLKVETRYNKDMKQLYREPGFDQKNWEKRAAKYFQEFSRRQQEMMSIIDQIAKRLDIKEFFIYDFEKPDFDYDYATEEERQEYAELMNKELLAHGEQF